MPRAIGISGSLTWPKTLMELIFNPYGEFRLSPEGPVSQIHSPHLHVVPLGSFKVFSDAKEREWDVESNGKLPRLFIPSKTATLMSEFAAEDLPLARTAALVAEFAVKDLPLGRTLKMTINTLVPEEKCNIGLTEPLNWLLTTFHVNFEVISSRVP